MRIFLIYILQFVFALQSCADEMQNVFIDYGYDCYLGCKLNFQYNTDTLKNAKEIKFKVISITTVEVPALLQNIPGKVPEEWFNSNDPINCTINKDGISCEDFIPIADHVILEGLLNDNPVKLDITIDSSHINPEDDELCGLYGLTSTIPDSRRYTTLERMYDCSKQIKNYAGFGNADGTFTKFVLGQTPPEKSWFVVMCPYTTSFDRERGFNTCSWLSPIIPKSRATSEGLYLSTKDGQEGMPMSMLIGKRVLWSGQLKGYGMEGGFSFFQTNGNNPWLSNPAQYDYYKPYPGTNYKMPSRLNGNINAPIFEKDCPNPNGCMDYFWGQYYLQHKTPLDICQFKMTKKNRDDVLLTDPQYHWEVPSYPVFLAMSGGGKGYCESGGEGFEKNIFHSCLNTKIEGNEFGLRAASSPVPGFSNFLRSSSVFSEGSSWIFTGNRGDISFGGIHDEVDVRCISVTW